MKCRHCGIKIIPSRGAYEGIKWVHHRPVRSHGYEVSCDPFRYYRHGGLIATPDESIMVTEILAKYEM